MLFINNICRDVRRCILKKFLSKYDRLIYFLAYNVNKKIKFPEEFKLKRGSSFTKWAAKRGYIKLIDFALNNGCSVSAHTCSAAARYGQFECLKYLREIGCKWNYHTSSGAALKGHLDCLTYAVENRSGTEYLI